MKEKTFLRIALPTPLRRVFDYLPPQDIDLNTLIPGCRVRVPFQSRQLVGILTDVVQESDVPYGRLKRAYEILDNESLFPKDIYALCQWAAEYYHYSLGEVLSSALPVLLRKGKPLEKKKRKMQPSSNPDKPLALNIAQQQAVDHICAAKNTFKTFLLDGVTGSGKTEVYLQSIADILQANQQVLVLVPEISLTPQTIERFRARFSTSTTIALHSGLSDQERLQAWMAARDGEANIIIGTRSAIFTPFANLGLIIVDEEHDTSFKQQDRFRYHARDLAILRASIKQIPIVLGSATPALESLSNVERARYTYLSLPERAGRAALPTFKLLDLRQTETKEGLSEELLNHMRVQLDAGNQVMLFLNRRGFAPVLYCTECAWIVNCKRCDARMIYHNKPAKLKCHHCDAQRPIPTQCEACQQKTLAPVGYGTQRLEETLAQIFPDVPIIRVDRDNTRRKGAMQDLITQIHAEKKAILLGTQMLAKGHHFPQVTLVGIIDADTGLFSADFRAAEQMGQLLLQVSGRAGRAELAGNVLIQTRYPDHPLLQTLIHSGYAEFARTLLTERKQALLPPFSYFAIFRAEAHAVETAQQFLTVIKQQSAKFADKIQVMGPTPAVIAKRKGMHCQHLLIKSEKRSSLQHFLKITLEYIEKQGFTQPVKWVLDVDPVDVI